MREKAEHIEAFEVWYANSRSSPRVAEHVRVSERHVRRWAEELGWHAKADERDAEAAKILEREAINRKAAMLKRHAQAGQLAVQRAIEKLAKHEIVETRDALAALKLGIEIERSVEDLPTQQIDVHIHDSTTELAARLAARAARRRESGIDSGAEPEGSD